MLDEAKVEELRKRIGDPYFERIREHLGPCRGCGELMIWATMIDADGMPKLKDGKPIRNPLNVDRVEPTRNAIVFAYGSGHGMSVPDATVVRAVKWIESLNASAHISHFATCTMRGRFRRDG